MNETDSKNLVSAALDRLLGRGRHAVTVPPMDGALQPNNLLDQATSVVRVPSPDNIVHHDGKLWFSSGPELHLFDLDSHHGECSDRFDAAICAIAVLPKGQAVAALAGGQLVTTGGTISATLKAPGHRVLRCPTAMLALDDRTLIVTEGSSRQMPSQWRTDLLQGGASGSVWRVDVERGDAQPVASGLSYPCGVAMHRDGSVVISEAWKHRLIKISASGERTVLLEDLPGYPSRISAALDGGYWLSIFAPRSQLVEFVLRESEYRERMIAEIDEAYWVAPALSSGRDFREPLQGGAIKSMGQLKPWAPSRSYGLICKLDAGFQPQWSAHSRADGCRHGVTETAEVNGQLYICSQGGDEIVALPAHSRG